MNELQIFENEEFGKVRTVVIDNEPWMVGKDVADALGYANSRDAISKHVDDEDKGVAKCDTLGGKQDLQIINESGMYDLVFGSKLPTAKKFKHWVTSEVLPTLRKTGIYTTRKIDNAANDKKLEIQKKRVETMAMNANTKRAKVMADLAKVAVLPSYQNTLIVSAANILAGKQIIALPTSEYGRERHPLGWYCKLVGKKESWATQMGKTLKQLGISKVHGKTGELVEFIDDGKHQRQTFEWYTDYLMPIVKEEFHIA